MYYLFILARVKGRPPSNGSDQDCQAEAEENWPVRTTTKTCVRDQAVILRGRDHIHDIENDLMVNPFLTAALASPDQSTRRISHKS